MSKIHVFKEACEDLRAAAPSAPTRHVEPQPPGEAAELALRWLEIKLNIVQWAYLDQEELDWVDNAIALWTKSYSDGDVGRTVVRATIEYFENFERINAKVIKASPTNRGLRQALAALVTSTV
jgi:hypothetical protein